MKPCYLLRILLTCAVFCGVSEIFAQELFRGMTEQELIEVKGQPTSQMGGTAKMLLMFDGVNAELRQGRLYSVEGGEMAYVTPGGGQFIFMTSRGWAYNGEPVAPDFRVTQPPEDMSMTSNQPTGVRFYRPGEETSPAGQPTTAVAEAMPPEPVQNPEPEPPSNPSPRSAPAAPTEETLPESMPVTADYGDTEMDFDDYEEYEDWELYAEEELTGTDLFIELAVRFVVEFLLTLLILKLSFENKGFPVLMPQLLLLSFLMSAISLGVLFGLEAIGLDSWAVYQGISYIVLSILIYWITDVQQAATAMSIALIARGVTAVVNYIILLAMMYLFFG